MYAAPLNYDRFFRKVFSDLNITKKFLEDFLSVKIEHIERIKTKHKITDAAALVEFDFRCKINGQYVIIDMQQWYKADVVKRFYIYQALNSSLQLETLPKKVNISKLGKKYEVKSYESILPTLTLIWMADDALDFELDSVSFALSLEQTTDFIKNDALWESKDFEKINIERQKILTLLNNKVKDLDFLPQNRLIFAFQKNIAKNPAFSQYKIWFEFAETTKNRDNKKEDFDKFKKNETIMEVLERIKIDKFEEEDKSILEEWESDFNRLAEYWSDYEDMKQKMKIKQHEVEAKQHEVEAKQQYLEKHFVRDKMAEIVKEEREKTVIISFERGLDVQLIAEITLFPLQQVHEIIEKHKNQSIS